LFDWFQSIRLHEIHLKSLKKTYHEFSPQIAPQERKENGIIFSIDQLDKLRTKTLILLKIYQDKIGVDKLIE
jgi:hypothetical protein